MTFSQPVALEAASLHALVQYVLAHHDQDSTLVFCGSKEGFIEQLTAKNAPTPAESNEPADPERSATIVPVQDAWSVPTLRLLSASRNVKLAFCPDITHLRAYLATYSRHGSTQRSNDGGTSTDGNRLLAIVNLIHLHRSTSAFSAQGLNRTLSGAVEAAYHSCSKLVIAECADAISSTAEDGMPEGIVEASHERPQLPNSVWDEEVSILNVTTKSFGAGERGWVGRTVKLRTVAARWCTFSTIDEP